MTDEELGEVLASIIGKPVTNAWLVRGVDALMLCFPEGKTVYISGENLKIELEAAN